MIRLPLVSLAAGGRARAHVVSASAACALPGRGPPSRLRYVLHSLRQRLQQFAEREAAGESLWSPAFSGRARTRIMHGVRRVQAKAVRSSINDLYGEAHRLIVEVEGVYSLTGSKDPPPDFFAHYQACPDSQFPTVLESLVQAFDAADTLDSEGDYFRRGYAASFVGIVNEILVQERVGWELIDGRMVEIHSRELHVAAIEPALRLLHRSEFAKADKQYRDALDELAQGKADDAITDAGATLQEMLEALGCEGNQLGDLARSAGKKNLLGAHDTPLVEAIEKTMHWVAADRSEMGDAHHATEATREDAWLIVHVVGALIVRLASGQERRK